MTNKDMIVLLNQLQERAVVALAEHGDSEEHETVVELLTHEIEGINTITERVKEMTAVEYLEARNEICDEYRCEDCPLGGYSTEYCAHTEANYPRRAVEIVKKWKEENT